jgi:hypothetical protein
MTDLAFAKDAARGGLAEVKLGVDRSDFPPRLTFLRMYCAAAIA